MACLSQLKNCNVHVYERTGPHYKRISAFDHPVDPEKKQVIRVLYCGGVHYGETIVCSAAAVSKYLHHSCCCVWYRCD